MNIGCCAYYMRGSSSWFQIVKDGDTDHDGALDFEEFTQYLRAHEKELKIMFSSLDRNQDGRYQRVLQLLTDTILCPLAFIVFFQAK